MSFLTAPLVAPSSAQSFYGSATTHSNSFTGSSNAAAFSGQPPEIVETARALKNDPDLIYEFVHNHIEIEFAFGERKGPLGALIDHSGTPFDQNVLFVNLVRQAGYQAQYVIAPVTMSQANFTNWSGINDIQAACRLLSSGGIPAAFNGAASSASDCSQIGSGNFTSVTFLHVYSQVNIGGAWYAYDPSFKAYTAPVGINLVSSSGLVSGQAAQAAATNITAGSTSGAPFIKNASTSSLNSYLTARGTALLSAIKTSAPAMDTEGVVGIGKIIPAYKPTGGWRTTTPSGYTASSGATVTGDIPDQYRTKLHVNVASLYTNAQPGLQPILDWTFYADDIDGRRVGLSTNFNRNEIGSASNWTTLAVRLVVDDVPIQAFGCTINWSSPSSCLPGEPTQLTLSVTHPFAANGGAYGAQTIQVPASTEVPTAIVAGFGYVSPNRLAKWSREVVSDTPLPIHDTPPFPCVQGDETCWSEYFDSTEDLTHQKTAANWLGQFSRLYKIHATLGHSVVDHLHSIGVVRWNYQGAGYYFPSFDPNHPPATLPPRFIGVTDQFETTDITTSLAVTQTGNSIPARNAVVRSIALSAATLEGSILEQTQDLPDSASTASRFAWGNHPDDEDPCFPTNTPRPIYDFTGTTSSTRSGLYLYEGSVGGCSAGPVIDDFQTSYSVTNFENSAEGLIAPYAAAGFHLSAPGEVFLGPGSRFGRAMVDVYCPVMGRNSAMPNQYCSDVLWNYHTIQRGAALIATLSDTSGNVTQVANVMSGFGLGILKGGGGKQPENASLYDPSKAADILKDRFVDKDVLLGVDLKTGAAGFSTPTLISVGSGKDPYKLDYSLTYKSAPDGCSFTGPCTSPITNGFNTSWDIRFSNSGSGEEALGSTSPMAAAGTLAAFLVMQDIFSETDRTDLEKDTYAALTADWWRQQMVANVATITRGFSGSQYVRLVDGTWMAPVHVPDVLTQTGTRSKIRDVCYSNGNTQANPQSTSRRWDFSGVNFSLREADGAVLSFAPWSWNYDFNQMCANAYGYKPTTLTYPQGVSLSFAYDYEQGVTGITSSLGRSMSFSSPTGGRQATVNGLSAGQTGINSNSITNAAGETWTFALNGFQPRSLTSYNRPLPYYWLQQVFEPVSTTLPALAYTYDTRGIVETIQDATGIQTTHHPPYNLYIAEGARGERDDPLGGAYTVYFDTDGNAVRHIDQLGHEVDSVYDGRHRVTNRTFPEGDQEQFAYDANDNVLGLTKVAKPASGLSNIVVSATYEPTWNHLASITDALQNTTSFTYYASGNGASLMSRAVRPAVNGSSPTYTFAYNAIGLPTQEVDATGVTTTHAYDSLGNLTATTRGVAAVGSNPALNLTTTSTFDAVGNVASTTDPRGNVTSYTYDAMRRKLSEQDWSGTTSGTLIAASQSTYDLNGRQLTSQRAKAINTSNAVTAWVTKTTAYTPNGKVSDVTDELGDVTHTSYDALDRVYQVTDATRRVTQTNYNADSSVLSEQRAVGTPLAQTYATYTYTADGFKTSTQDARGNTSQDLPDGFNRLAKTTFPDGNTEIYTYDANDNVVTWQNRGGFQIQRTYDVLNRKITEKGVTNGTPNLNSRSWDIPDRTFTYDLAGRPTGATNSNWVHYWTYEAAGRIATMSDSLGNAFVYTYDGVDNITGLTYPNSVQVGYTYDAMSRMTGATLGSTSVAALAYDVLGRRTLTTFGDGSSTGYGYDDADRLTSQSQVFPNGTSANVTETFGYDNAGRLISKAITNTAYQYTPPVATTSFAAADSMNRYSNVSGVANTYWAEGGVNNDGRLTYVYDETGAFRTGYDTANNSDAVYRDALGQSITRITQYSGGTDILQYYSIADRPEVRLDLNYTSPHNAGAWAFQGYRDYVLGPNPDERLAYQDTNGTIYYPHVDRQGTTIGIATAGQNVLTRTYGPYGEPLQQMTTGTGASSYPYLYTGQYFAGYLKLYDYKARLYNPIWGRFYQSDPIGTKDDLNLYQYTHNDPLDHTDPSGNDAAAALGVLSNVGKLDAAEEIAGLGPENPVADAAVGITTVGGLVYAGYKLFQPGEAQKSESRSGPGKNDPHVNQDRKARAAEGAQKAKEKYEQLKSKPNKTPEDKKALDKAKKDYEHQKGKAEEKGENHSQKGKGQQS